MKKSVTQSDAHPIRNETYLSVYFIFKVEEGEMVRMGRENGGNGMGKVGMGWERWEWGWEKWEWDGT